MDTIIQLKNKDNTSTHDKKVLHSRLKGEKDTIENYINLEAKEITIAKNRLIC